MKAIKEEEERQALEQGVASVTLTDHKHASPSIPTAGGKPTAAAAGGKTAAAASTSSSSATTASPAAAAGEKNAKSSADLVAEHRAAWQDLQRKLCKSKYSVGHWLGLSTPDRKDLAIALCQELLFNPQPKPDGPITTTVQWNATSYWTTYEVDVECIKTMADAVDSSKQRITTYRVHVDDAGRLQDFEIFSDGVSQGCSIM